MSISPLRRCAAAAAAVTLATGLVACSGAAPGSPDGAISVSVLPGIAHQGSRPAKPEDASMVVSARFDEGSAGREVTLEAGSKGSWKATDSAEVPANGVVDFVVDGSAEAYRVVAEGSGDLSARTSTAVDSDAWAEPDFSETFDGENLSDAWVHRGPDYNPEGLRRCSKGSPDAVEVGGGTARLLVVDDPTRDDSCEALAADGESLGEFDYRLNGHIASNALFVHGVTAARIKFHRDKGQHGSFWLQSNLGVAPTDPLESGAEIDVVEYFGESKDDRLASFVYYPTKDGSVKEGDWIEDASDFLAGRNDDWWKAFHVFSVEWTKDEYVIRIDGREAWRTSEGISGQPEFIVLSLLSSDYELPNLPEGALPQAMHVDWVQHWAPSPG